jgi:exodeoxyribonuclease-5
MELIIKNIEPINEEQKRVIKEVRNFINNGDPNDWFVLEGKAGTGKTTIITKVIEPYINKKRIEVSALSHKAKKVLWNKVIDVYGEENIGLSSRSVSSMLGMTLDMESGKFTKIFSKKKPPIRWDDIIIVDEASMINEEGLKLIMELKKPKAKVIFIGDVGQLPPIREDGDENVGKISPVFNTMNKITLLNRVRQSSDSNILPYSDFYWDNSVKNDGIDEDPIPLNKRKSCEQMVFSDNLEEVLSENVDLFLESIQNKNTDLVKVIVYRNNTKKAINWYIRNLLFGQPKEYELGEIIIFNDNYIVDDIDEDIIENSSEWNIVQITEKVFYKKYKGYTLVLTDEQNTYNVDVISSESINDWNKHVSDLFTKAKKEPFGKSRKLALMKAWEAKKRFADIDYAYTITSHKSQGSTYKNVIVVEDDILEVAMIGNIEKSQSLYVAITRASDKVYIVSGLNS